MVFTVSDYPFEVFNHLATHISCLKIVVFCKLPQMLAKKNIFFH